MTYFWQALQIGKGSLQMARQQVMSADKYVNFPMN